MHPMKTTSLLPNPLLVFKIASTQCTRPYKPGRELKVLKTTMYNSKFPTPQIKRWGSTTVSACMAMHTQHHGQISARYSCRNPPWKPQDHLREFLLDSLPHLRVDRQSGQETGMKPLDTIPLQALTSELSC